MRKLLFAVFCLLALAGCTTQTPPVPPDLTPPTTTSVETPTREQVEKADNAVRAAAIFLKNMCPTDAPPLPGNEEMCSPDKARPGSPKEALNGTIAECKRVYELYNLRVQEGRITSERIVLKVTENARFGGKITCEAP